MEMVKKSKSRKELKIGASLKKRKKTFLKVDLSTKIQVKVSGALKKRKKDEVMEEVVAEEEVNVAAKKRKAVSRVDVGVVTKAVDALKKWVSSQKKRDKASLLEDEELLYLVVALKKIPERSRTNPFRIPIVHPLYPLDGSQDVCLIVNDLDRGVKTKDAKEKIAAEGICITKVIGVSKLKTDYFPFEARRKLCGSYDLFLADDRILPSLPKLLGKTFFKKKKHPIPVTLTRQQWKGQMSAACGSTFMYISGGSCSVVKVARVSQSREEVIENVLAVIEGVGAAVPKKWSNIRALYLKTLESVALPLYQSLPDMPFKIEPRTVKH